MKGKRWYEEPEDDLELLNVEIEEIENDEISPAEAGFIYGYEERD